MDENNQNSQETDKDKSLLKPQNHKKSVRDFQESPFEKYQKKFSTSVSTVILGLIFLIIGFILLGYSEGLIIERNTVKALKLTPIEQLSKTKGMVKLKGVPIQNCELNNDECNNNLIYSNLVRFELKGEEWVVISEYDKFISFTLGNILINPKTAVQIHDIQEKSIVESQEVINGEEVQFREITYGVGFDEELIVVGELIENTISGGNVFIISNKSSDDLNDELIERLDNIWWVTKISAWLLLMLGFIALTIPIIVFLDAFPGLGWLVHAIVLVLGVVFSSIIVFLTTLTLRYWWLIFVIIFIIVILILRIKFLQRKSKLKS